MLHNLTAFYEGAGIADLMSSVALVFGRYATFHKSFRRFNFGQEAAVRAASSEAASRNHILCLSQRPGEMLGKGK